MTKKQRLTNIYLILHEETIGTLPLKNEVVTIKGWKSPIIPIKIEAIDYGVVFIYHNTSDRKKSSLTELDIESLSADAIKVIYNCIPEEDKQGSYLQTL